MEMSNYFTDIRDFHTKFGLAYVGPPRDLDTDLQVFRTRFMVEELCEYAGMDQKTTRIIQQMFIDQIAHHGIAAPAKALDALVDLTYVVLGTAHLNGYDFDRAWHRVHDANMRKMRVPRDGSDPSGREAPQFDVVKPPGWTAPDLSDLVQS